MTKCGACWEWSASVEIVHDEGWWERGKCSACEAFWLTPLGWRFGLYWGAA